MALLQLDDRVIEYHEGGRPTGAPILFLQELGTSAAIWEPVIAALPDHCRIIRYELRGHGASGPAQPPYSMGALVKDAERLLDALHITGAVCVGIGLGGMVAQGLAVKRLDQVRALVLSGTAPKIGTKTDWLNRAEMAERGEVVELCDMFMARWFSRKFLASGAAKDAREIFLATNPSGLAGCCAAIAGTDFLSPTSGLRLPTRVLAGTEDRITPPDLMRDLAELIPGAGFDLLRGAGHVAPVDAPDLFAGHLSAFLTAIGHGENQ